MKPHSLSLTKRKYKDLDDEVATLSNRLAYIDRQHKKVLDNIN